MSVEWNPGHYSTLAVLSKQQKNPQPLPDGLCRTVGIHFGWGGASFPLWHLTADQELPQVSCQI